MKTPDKERRTRKAAGRDKGRRKPLEEPVAARQDGEQEVPVPPAIVPQATSEMLAARLLGQFSGLSGPGVTPTAAADEERRLRLQEALDRLGGRERELLALRHFARLSWGEVAQVLGIRPEAAKASYYDALERLGSLLKDRT